MNILVTGGAGYIGSVLIPMLLKPDRNCTVTVIDNFMYGQTPLLSEIWDERLTVRNENLDFNNVDLSSFDAVVHLACITGMPACDKDPFRATHTNLGLVQDLVKMLPKGKRLIFPCTNSGYGIGQKSIECDEKTPLKPISLYGRLKVAAEEEVLKWGGVSLRFATLFGMSPRMRLDLLVNDFVYRALNDGFLVLFESHFKRNYLHVLDAVSSIIFILERYHHPIGEAYNVGLSDTNISKLELAQKIKEYLPETVIIESEISKDKDKRNYIVSNKKIEATGFRPSFSLDDGIKELIRGHQIIRRNQFSNV